MITKKVLFSLCEHVCKASFASFCYSNIPKLFIVSTSASEAKNFEWCEK